MYKSDKNVFAKGGNRLNAGKNGGDAVMPQTESLKSLAARWLDFVKQSVKESTYTRYFRAVNGYILPLAGNTPVLEMNSEHIHRMTKKLMTDGGKRKKGLSPKTVSDILCVLKSILRYGARKGCPVPDTESWKYPPKAAKIIKVLSENSLKAIENRLIGSDDMTDLGIIFTLYTGVRIGELCGLKWGDFDFDAASVTISRTIGRIADLSENAVNKTKIVITEPKTANSTRVIPIPDFLSGYLRKMRRGDGCWFLTGTEKFVEPHQYYMMYKKRLREIGAGEYSFHSLRHTFATRCVELGFDVKSLSEILGHSNISTTLSVYVHPTLKQKRRQMERLSAFFVSHPD